MTIPVGYYQANVVYTEGGGTPLGAQWTFGGKLNSLALLTAEAVAEAVHNTLQATTIEAQMSDSSSVQRVDVKFGPDDVGESGSFVEQIAGTVASDTVAPNVALLVRKLTGLGGRRGRGRMYIPGLPETHVGNAGMLTGGQEAAWQVIMTAFFDGLATLDIPMYLLHDPEHHWVLVNGQPRFVPVPGSVAPAPTIVTALDVEPRVASQRRRNRS